MSRHRTVIGLGGASRYVDHGRQDPVLAMGALTVGLAQPSPGAQAFGQVTAQRATRLHIAGLVDRFGGHPQLRVIGVATLVSALVLDYGILSGKTSNDAIGLYSTGAAIYLRNTIVFGIWYWELHRGGPFNRAAGTDPHPDFLFPQMVSPEMGPEHWEPRYLDYLYTSFTNVMAFSPTDTMPLSRWAKSLMALQSAIALSTTALVLARAVNILK